MPEIEFPREFPKNQGHRRPCLTMIDDAIQKCIDSSIKIGKKMGNANKYILLQGTVLFSTFLL